MLTCPLQVTPKITPQVHTSKNIPQMENSRVCQASKLQNPPRAWETTHEDFSPTIAGGVLEAPVPSAANLAESPLKQATLPKRPNPKLPTKQAGTRPPVAPKHPGTPSLPPKKPRVRLNTPIVPEKTVHLRRRQTRDHIYEENLPSFKVVPKESKKFSRSRLNSLGKPQLMATPKLTRKATITNPSAKKDFEASLKSFYVGFSKTPPPLLEGDARTLKALQEQLSEIKNDFSMIRYLVGEIETRQAALEAELSTLKSAVTQASAHHSEGGV